MQHCLQLNFRRARATSHTTAARLSFESICSTTSASTTDATICRDKVVSENEGSGEQPRVTRRGTRAGSDRASDRLRVKEHVEGAGVLRVSKRRIRSDLQHRAPRDLGPRRLLHGAVLRMRLSVELDPRARERSLFLQSRFESSPRCEGKRDCDKRPWRPQPGKVWAPHRTVRRRTSSDDTAVH